MQEKFAYIKKKQYFCGLFLVGSGLTTTSLLCNSCSRRTSSSPQKLKFPGAPREGERSNN